VATRLETVDGTAREGESKRSTSTGPAFGSDENLRSERKDPSVGNHLREGGGEWEEVSASFTAHCAFGESEAIIFLRHDATLMT
jgi:hypothetical protein